MQKIYRNKICHIYLFIKIQIDINLFLIFQTSAFINIIN
ncbi:hypothetical protein BN1221_03067c [Brenneria goodwinii]|uniref:Uncharacterized protein n=1 Tax=Brenneria goodwinii TaxID=1109412 RepID=A0A0G4JY40_9GAMM|nr:hypothetical protein BN1221_03067c [Brenneria goodwinii]